MTQMRPGLPEPLSRTIRSLVDASGLTGAAARELTADLTEYARDGLEAGRTPDELAARLGDPTTVAPRLAAARPSRPRRPDPDRTEGAWTAFLSDLRLTLRSLARNRGLTATGAMVLGLGIAATATAFTVVNEAVLRPLPVVDQAGLVDVWAHEPGGNSFAGFGLEDVREYRAALPSNGALQELAAFAGVRLSLGEGSARQDLVGQLVSRDYFPMLGVGAVVGGTSLEEAPELGGPRTVVLSHGLWEEGFGADPEIVGRALVLDGESYTVIGVASPGFRGHFIGFPVDLWLPITAVDLVFPGFDPNDRARMPFEMIGRLAPGGTAEAAQAQLNVVAAALETRYPETHQGHRVGVSPTSGLDHSLRPFVLAFVGIIAVLASLVLVIAGLNVGSLLLVRTLAREGELAVRLALGAGRGRLVGQLLTEALLLTALGTAVGLLLSRIVAGRLDALFRQFAPGLGLELPFDARVLALTVVSAVAAALVVGAAPALHVVRRAPAASLGGRSTAAGSSRSRSVLVATQVAVSVALVITTGLFARSLRAGLSVDPGFAADQVASFVVQRDEPSSTSALEELLGDLSELPTVEGATVADGAPTGLARSPAPMRIPGTEPPPDMEAWAIDVRRVGADYLDLTGVALLRGRDFTAADARNGPGVAVVNQAFVERFWPADDPLGRSLEVDGDPVRVVGVAADARTLVQDDTPDPFVYVSLAGRAPAVPVVTLRASAPEVLHDEVRDVIEAHDPGMAPPALTVARETLDAGLLAQRLGAVVVGVLGIVALALASVGLFGLIQFSVRRDRHELAVRLALGGRGADVFSSVLRKGLTLVGIGAVAGVALAALASPGLAGFLVGVGPRDPYTYGAVVLLFAAVAIVACAIPARRAMSIPPASALRGE